MKVIMLLGRSTGGIGTHVAQLSADLRRLGVDVLVVTHPLTAEHFDLGPARLCWPGSGGAAQALRDYRTLRRLVATADVVHAHGHQGGLLATLSTLGMRSAPGVIVSQHNAVLKGSGQQLLKRLSQRWVTRHVDLMTGASTDLVREALAFGARRAELAEVPSPRVPELLALPPADMTARVRIRKALLSSITPDQVHDSPPVPLVVTISRIAPQKNLPVLLQAASRLSQACTWVVVGDGDPQLLARLRLQATAQATATQASTSQASTSQESTSQESTSQESTSQESTSQASTSQASASEPVAAPGVAAQGATVHFVGPSREIEQWLRGADVFVLTSEWEARALVVQEAMAAGTPVVATDVGGLHDLVLGTGLLVPPGDPEAIAKAVDRILANPLLREELAIAGREAAGGLPDGSDTASQWLAWYSQTAPMT